MQLHPLNTEFTWQMPAPPYQLITEAEARAYHEDGGFVLPDAFTVEEMTALIEALDPIEEAANEFLTHLPADEPGIARANEIVFRPHAVLESEVAEQFARHQVFADLCRDLIGPRVRLYWDQLVYKRSNTAEEFPWHQDNGYTFVVPQHYLTCWVALTDATVANGCPWIAPGLHRQGTLRHRWTELGFDCLGDEPVEGRALPVAAGSIAVFSSLTPHRTGPNLTADVRKAYILQFAVDGTVVHSREGEVTPADDPARQFLVVEDVHG